MDCRTCSVSGGQGGIGSSPKIPTSKVAIRVFYCTWPVVVNSSCPDCNNTVLDRHRTLYAVVAKVTFVMKLAHLINP